MAWHGMPQYRTAWYGIVWHGMACNYGIAWHGNWHGMVYGIYLLILPEVEEEQFLQHQS